MTQSTAATAERVAGSGAGLVTVGIDVSDRYSQLCVLGDDGAIVREQRVRTTTAALTRALSTVRGARVVLEVGPLSPWLSRMLADLGHDVIVANPRRVALIARSQRKTDRSDDEQLARLGRFDPELLAPIRHRGAEIQADLEMLRSRDALIRSRTTLINHVRGAVKAWGAALPSCTARTFHRKAAGHMPEKLRAALLPLLRQIEHLTGAIRQADRRSTRCANATPQPRRSGRIVGVGPITALTFVLTIEDPQRFPKTREIGAFLGCRASATPVSASPSCGSRRRGTRPCGGCWSRRPTTSSAPSEPTATLRRWGLRYAESGAGNAKKRAVAAVARRLAVLLLALWKSGEVYEPLRHVRVAEAA